MRDAAIKALCELGTDARVMALICDTGQYVFRHFAERYPAQFINMGIAEQNVIGVSAGLALSGQIPFTYSISAFYARAIDQIRVDLCYNRTNVKMIGVGSGLAYGTMGPTHHSIEDIAILRAMPGMTILSPADPQEAAEAIHQAYQIDGPVYIRLAQAGEPVFDVLHQQSKPFFFNQIKVARQGTQATIVATGRILGEALAVADMLAQDGIDCAVLNVHVLKPFAGGIVKKYARTTGHIVTVEEHNIIGGLGSIVADTLVGMKVKFIRLGLRDVFCPVYGDKQFVYNAVGLSADHIAKKVKGLLDG